MLSNTLRYGFLYSLTVLRTSVRLISKQVNDVSSYEPPIEHSPAGDRIPYNLLVTHLKNLDVEHSRVAPLKR